ncbi:hypothetical protein CDD83_3912 [Cordyceps sp. RAO-2017]|nr:hypothetical protein CDD83_3912 [Cordyceps sp. RAO-2017]
MTWKHEHPLEELKADDVARARARARAQHTETRPRAEERQRREQLEAERTRLQERTRSQPCGIFGNYSAAVRSPSGSPPRPAAASASPRPESRRDSPSASAVRPDSPAPEPAAGDGAMSLELPYASEAPRRGVVGRRRPRGGAEVTERATRPRRQTRSAAPVDSAAPAAPSAPAASAPRRSPRLRGRVTGTVPGLADATPGRARSARLRAAQPSTRETVGPARSAAYPSGEARAPRGGGPSKYSYKGKRTVFFHRHDANAEDNNRGPTSLRGSPGAATTLVRSKQRREAVDDTNRIWGRIGPPDLQSPSWLCSFGQRLPSRTSVGFVDTCRRSASVSASIRLSYPMNESRN